MNKHILDILFFSMAFCVICIQPICAQDIEIIDAVQEPFTPESLIRNYFIGEGVQIVDIKFEGENEATGYFSNGMTDLGIDQGILLGTGKVSRFSEPNTDESSTLTSNQDVINQELADIIGADLLKDVATYEITFIPSADSIQFNYVFASEEYPEYVCSEFNDVFGFFISGANPSGGQYNSQNIAIVPGTGNLPVSINNVNSGMAGSSGNQSDCATLANLNNAQFYNSNTSQSLVFDGILNPFIAAAAVIPCETYTIKFSIGDVNDFLKDSAVFLEGKSFSSNVVELKAVTINSNGTVTEGCADASILFELPSILNVDEEVTFQLLGTAQNGIDYETIPGSIIIPAGESSASINIIPLEDNLEEEIESIGIVIMNGACLSDTIWVGIEDNYLIAPQEQGPIYLCNDLPNGVDYSIPFTPPSPTVFRNQTELRIEPTFEPVYSAIYVENIYPSTLNQTDFIKVCIDELSHPWIDDLSIYLYGPDNQFIELTSKNGGNGGNGTMTDFYLNTCFTFDAGDLITNPNFTPPFIGEFQPEGNWDDFFGQNSYKVNGQWRLMMIDDYQGSVGTLHSWSIHFGKTYNVSYSWSPSDGISCTDCPDPSFDPISDQVYTLDIEDTNGCSLSYEVDVKANSSPTPEPNVTCMNTSASEITFSWNEIIEAESYQVSINGGAWEDIGSELSYTISQLDPGLTISIEVQAIGACTESAISISTCMTSECEVLLQLESMGEPECDIENSGYITVQASGGSEPYTYSLGDVENITGIFENITQGEHLINVIDVNDCSGELLVLLEGKDEIIIEGIVHHIECEEETGSIDLEVSGGLGSLDIQWSDNFTGDISALHEGTYYLIVTDEDGCSAEEFFTIDRVADFTAEFNLNNPLCSEDFNGSIEVSINDPSLIVDITWSNGMTGPSIENLNAGLYSVVITSPDGCKLTKDFELIASTEFEIDIIKEDNFCHGDNQGFTSIEVSGGTSPYDISWSNNSYGHLIQDLVAGSYTATVSDMAGCETIHTIEIGEPEELFLDNLLIENPSCENMEGSITVYPSGGTAPYLAKLNQGSFEDQMSFSNLSPGNYDIEIMDSYGCIAHSQQAVSILQVEEMILETNPLISTEIGVPVSLYAQVTNRDTEIEYEWEGIESSSLSCTNCQEPIFTGFNTSNFIVKATDENGCQVIQNVTIKVDFSADIFVPNAFSPNDDGINDKLSVFAKSNIISSLDEFSLYDRWGEQVFFATDMQINNVNHGWDGHFKGTLLNQGVYVWKLRVTFIDGSTHNLSGDVTLLK